MPLDIHLGVRSSEVDTLRNQIVRMVPVGIDFVEVESAWRSDFTETFLDEVVHLVITTMTPIVILNFLSSRFDTFLVPMSGQEYDGVKLYVTDRGGEQEYIELRYPD